MYKNKHIISKKGTHQHIGGKAKNLLILDEMGVNVPKWCVIPQEILLEQLPAIPKKEDVAIYFQDLQVPTSITSKLAIFFGKNYLNKTYAVRSSAIDEDGQEFSFAGQFETFLHVDFSDIEERIKSIWRSVTSERVLKYRAAHNLPLQFGIAVIVQEMINPDVAGVAFGMNPVSGNEEEKIISSVYGLGEGLVSGELDADTFTIDSNKTLTQIAKKTDTFVQNGDHTGITKVAVEAHKQEIPSLSTAQLKEIVVLLDKLKATLGTAQDIEFAYANKQLFLLQTRPVTATKQEKGAYILWDNSNIIESYPGITTPLTFSFIIKMYERVYRQFTGIMGVKSHEIEQHASVFANTLGLVRGRVYYNLLSWYKMLAMLPGYSLNAGFMEKMMGVKERFELKEDYQMSKRLAWLRIVQMLIKMIGMQRRLPKERKTFFAHLNQIMQKYKAIDFDNLSPAKIIQHYKIYERDLLLQWKAPLINDFFAMIWFGMLAKQASKYCPEEPNIHNDLLCGSQDIISVEPIHRTIEISTAIRNNEAAFLFFKENTPAEIWAKLCQGHFPNIKASVDQYINRFGERCVGELKLETISYAQNPSLFIRILKAYAEQGITQDKKNASLENDLRKAAEDKIAIIFKGKPLKHWWFKYVTEKARDLVSNRENLRYERTRGFGMVRTMFSALGKQWHIAGKIDDPRDVFYLELPEIKACKNGLFEEGLYQKIGERKTEFAQYETQMPPQERFYTYGQHFTDAYIYSAEKIEGAEKKLSGIGCCPGKIQGKVRVVKDPREIDTLNGDILVTSSTDPGWVILFPSASAIIVERGSLLSHSAIVSREMGIPCIVSVTGLLRTLKTGDEIIMDGSTGEIQLISPKSIQINEATTQ